MEERCNAGDAEYKMYNIECKQYRNNRGCRNGTKCAINLIYDFQSDWKRRAIAIGAIK